MAEKAGFNAATGFAGGATIGINADSWPEFVQLCESVWPGEGLQVAQGLYANLKAQAKPVSLNPEQQAVGQLQQQLGAVPAQSAPYGTTPEQQWGGQAQGGWSQPAPQQQAQNGPPPGQTCDPRDPEKTFWRAPGITKSGPRAGQPYNGFWTYPPGHPKARGSR